jgi:hypothetical protein
MWDVRGLGRGGNGAAAWALWLSVSSHYKIIRGIVAQNSVMVTLIPLSPCGQHTHREFDTHPQRDGDTAE